MFLVGLFLLFLMIAPQLWWEPMVGLPVDALMTPLLFVTALGTGRLTSLLRFSMVYKLFLGFILSPVGQRLAQDEGLVAVR